MYRNPDNHAAGRRLPIGLMLAAGAALLLGTGPGMVSATAQAAEAREERVQIADLDLRSPQGQRTLERRVRIAIRKVCEPVSSPRPSDRRIRQQRDQCHEQARADVVRQLRERGLPAQLRSLQADIGGKR